MKVNSILLAPAVAAAVLLPGQGVVQAGVDSPRQAYEAKLGSKRAGAPSGLTQSIDYLPAPGSDKPYAVSKITFRLPRGAVVDTAAVPRCEATDPELIASGPSACAADTVVGAGALSADTGTADTPLAPRVIHTQVTFINAADQLILLAESTNTEPVVRVVSRIKVRGRRLVSSVPPLPGAPPPEPFLAIDEVVNDLDRIRTDEGTYIRTPRHCFARGFWTVRARFQYRDGVVQRESSRTPCRSRR